MIKQNEQIIEICQKCIDNYILENTKCVYFKTKYPHCQKYDNENNVCEECVSGYTIQEKQCRVEKFCKTIQKGICVDCVESYYHSTVTHKCTKCSSNCKKCIGSLCHECFNGYALESSSCHIASISHCQVYESITNCKQCDYGFGVYKNDDDEYGKCVECEDVNCLRCDYNQSVCTQCQGDYLLMNGKCHSISPIDQCTQYDSETLECIDCFDGFYISEETHLCEKCSDMNCLECQSDGKCLKCFDGFYLENGECIQCNEPCDKCEMNTENKMIECLSCKIGYYFDDKTKECKECLSPCKECNSESNCISCFDGYYLHNEGTVLNEENTCISCSSLTHYNCQTCSEKECNSCSDDKILVSVEIEEDKLVGTSKETISICRTPQENCLEYSKDKDECKYCFLGFKLSNGKCISTESNCLEKDSQSNKCISCHDGYYLSEDFTCQLCSSSCKTCEHTKNYCTSCHDGYELSDYSQCNQFSCQQEHCAECLSSNSACSKCMDGYYLSENGCVSCGENCKTCDSNGFCIECAIENTPNDYILTTNPNENGDCIIVDYTPEDEGLETKDIIMIVSIVVVIVFFIIFTVGVIALKLLHKWILKKIDPHANVKYQRLE